MQFDTQTFFTALGLAFVLEGVVWTLFPSGMRNAMLHLIRSSVASIRAMGLVALGIGMLIVWLARL